MFHSLTRKEIQNYKDHLQWEEKSSQTIGKYLRDVQVFFAFLSEEKEVSKEVVMAYKEHLTVKYAVSTVNSMLAAVNGFLTFLGQHYCRVKPLKQQRRIFRDQKRELNRGEYQRLLAAAQAQGNQRLFYIMQTLCATGIRISELPFVTVEAVKAGRASVRCKGKQRLILLPNKLRRGLEGYCRKNRILTGAIFVTRSGRPMSRTNIWREMKGICRKAGVEASKVFPHNLRRLFAVTFYQLEKDLAKLADLLGHASVETTRIYLMESGEDHMRQVERLGLVV